MLHAYSFAAIFHGLSSSSQGSTEALEAESLAFESQLCKLLKIVGNVLPILFLGFLIHQTGMAMANSS